MEERDFNKEFKFITSKSSGAGGQHVNKVNTKVELRFDIDNSQLLTTEEKELLKINLVNHINNEGFLQIVSHEERSQLKNRKSCIEKFYQLIAKCFIKPKKRIAVEPSKLYVEKRLEKKKKVSFKKELRRKDNINIDFYEKTINQKL